MFTAEGLVNGMAKDAQSSSPSTVALLSLTQDIAALISLSVESTASLLHDWLRTVVGTLGVGGMVNYSPPVAKSTIRGESGRGAAVVVLGASEATGQSLTLHLAKSGYTVFPFLPLPTPSSPPTTSALSTLLLAWSGMQKRLRSRHPEHPGAVVPVVTDSENSWELSPPSSSSPTSAGFPGKNRGPLGGGGGGKFAHAGETVRVYCRENGLSLVAVICAARGPRRRDSSMATGSRGGDGQLRRIGGDIDQAHSAHDKMTSTTMNTWRDPSSTQSKLTLHLPPPPPSPPPPISSPSPSSLLMSDETTLLSLYRSNILEPLSVIRELSDLLSSSVSTGKGRGRVIFVGGGESVTFLGEMGDNVDDASDNNVGDDAWTRSGAWNLIARARDETSKILRRELGRIGIDVCEVVAGPLSPRVGPLRYHHLSNGVSPTEKPEEEPLGLEKHSDNSTTVDVAEADRSLTRYLSKEAIFAQRLTFLSRLWAVDDALLYSAVRRAIEDRYPRYRHHAGLSPLVGTIAEITPGSGLIKMIGRWVLGRLLMPRGGSQG